MVVSAELRLFSIDVTQEVECFGILDNSWTENAHTWDSKPGLGESPIDSTGGFRYIWDVTNYIDGDGAYSFALLRPETQTQKFSSKEGGGQQLPELIVAFTG